MSVELHDWWAQLRHGGVLVAPQLLPEFFPSVERYASTAYDRLRSEWLRFSAASPTAESRRNFVDAVLEDFCGLQGWQKGSQVEARFKTTSPMAEVLRPQRVLLNDDNAVLGVIVDDTDRVGIGRGRRAHSRLVELLRGTGVPLGVLTNGVQFRIVHAGPDYDAWAEWDANAWFDIAEGREQLAGLRVLLGPKTLLGSGDAGLRGAVRASRTRQGDLAQVLGDQVRRAIEQLLTALDSDLRRDPDKLARIAKDPVSGQRLGDRQVLSALYQAATRIVMRLVVVLFAESRDLLPSSTEVYHRSYSIEGLYHQLTDAELSDGRGALGDRHGGWLRILALVHAVWAGSPHPDLILPAYGGTLFRAGDSDDPDPVLRAVAAFDDADINDETVLRVLRYLKVGRMRVKRGRQTTWVQGPVDFSDLRTEYIGIIYEGLLDYELKRADANDPVVFLNLGGQPALPLQRLESLSDDEVKRLIAGLRKSKATTGAGEEEAEEEEEEEEEEESEAEGEDALAENGGADSEEDTGEPNLDPADTAPEDLQRRVYTWAERAVELSGLARRPRGRNPDLRAFERQRAEASRGLVASVVPAGGMYLVAWGGLRKGTGTFYTRPQLAVPLTQRTLEPLCYDVDEGSRTPKTPDKILALRVCDPAMGSGSFLVAALRYLTDALAASLIAHGHIIARNDESTVTLPFGSPASGDLREELLPTRPDHDQFDSLLRARLARHIVERCIYGVDVNPLAVELARLALWVETLDRELPFEFLDHKLKVGDSLVGGWLDLILDYPALAWERTGGDEKHSDFHHHYRESPGTGRVAGQVVRAGDPWTAAIARVRAEVVRPELEEEVSRRAGTALPLDQGQAEALRTLESVVQVVQEMEVMAIEASAERATAYETRVVRSQSVQDLHAIFDRWCSIWFWPPDELGECATPLSFQRPSAGTQLLASSIAEEHRFFHWELEFPDVFASNGGFDAVLANPPWDVQKPNSKEFFSNIDPLYRIYDKQSAMARQRQLFAADGSVEEDWIRYCSDFRALANWRRHVAHPFGDPAEGDTHFSVGHSARSSKEFHRAWRSLRGQHRGLVPSPHPYQSQGSGDMNTYKMFLEQAHALVRPHGRLGFLVPSGLYTDDGSRGLRALLLDKCSWEWLFSFENRESIFPIDSSQKFACIIATKGPRTESIRAAFMRTRSDDWEAPQPNVLEYPAESIGRFNPDSLAILEVENRDHLAVLDAIYDGAERIGGSLLRSSGFVYKTEFHMTSASKKFLALDSAERRGAMPMDYGMWSLSDQLYASLYTGKMISQYDFCYQTWVEGRGNRAKWRELNWNEKNWHPEFLLSLSEVTQEWGGRVRLVFRDMAKSINERSMIAAVIPVWPCGNKVPILSEEAEAGLENVLKLCAVLNSFVFDFVVRSKLTGINLNKFIVYECPVPPPDSLPPITSILAARLALCHEVFAPQWTTLLQRFPELAKRPWRSWWATSQLERTRLRCLLEAIVADSYGLDAAELDPEALDSGQFAWILNPDPTRKKGFWRVDRKMAAHAKLPRLSLDAFRALRGRGLAALAPDAEATGWELPPPAVKEIDDGLGGHDEEADTAGSWSHCKSLASEVDHLWRSGAEVRTRASTRKPKKTGDGQMAIFDELT